MNLLPENERSSLSEQFRSEVNSWKKTLEYVMEENSFLKNRLGALLRFPSKDPEFLENAEYFQNKFMKQDETIAFLRKDVEDHLQELESENRIGKVNKITLTRKQHQLRTDIETTEESFNNMLFEFNNFLALTLSK